MSSEARPSLPAQPHPPTAAPNPAESEVLISIWEHLNGSLGGGKLTVEHCRIEPLPRRPGSRHVSAYHLLVHDEGSGQKRILALIAKRDTTRGVGKAAREYAALNFLWDEGFGSERQLKIPKPFDLLPNQNLILHESACGTKLTGSIGGDSAESTSHFRMSGLWLAKLHGIKLSPPVTCSYDAELASLDLFVRELSGALPPAPLPRVQKLAEAIGQRLASCTDVTASLVHGDYHPEHIFVADDSITVIDFERFGCGDPAKDVGSFLAHTRSSGCLARKPPRVVDQETGEFLASYFSALPLATGAATASRISAFDALSSLEALYYVAAVLKVDDQPKLTAYLECAERSGVLLTHHTAIRRQRAISSPQYQAAAGAGA